jgi:hypothetical protein
MRPQHVRAIMLCASTFSLAACGGAGGGVASSPPPPVTPTPAPTPTPTPTPTSPLAPAHLGLVSAAPFAVLGIGNSYKTDPQGGHITPVSGPSAQTIQFSFDAATNTYQISLPGFQSGTLASPGYSGSAGEVATSSTSQVTAGSSASLQPVFVSLFTPGSHFSPYTYTSLGSWSGSTGTDASGNVLRSGGQFVYGIPTVPGGMPTTGSASYSAEIRGSSNVIAFPVTGSASLLFDFGAGTLAGSMHPVINDSFDGIHFDFGQFDFAQTVYSRGSTTFSGKFSVGGVGVTNSFFDGSFTGPNGAELMARFATPYSAEGTISGVWIGKKN